MKVYKFPNVNNEYWDGSGLKKRHLNNLAQTIKHQARVDAAKVILDRIEERLDAAERVVIRLKAEAKKAKTEYFKHLEGCDEDTTT